AYSKGKAEVALLIVRDGNVLFERYRPGTSPNEPQRIYSGTKGFWCVLAAAAQQDGILKLQEPVGKILSDWRSGEKGKVTIRELLNFTSGLPATNALHGQTIPDRDAYARRLKLSASPGSLFQYGPAALQVFDATLQHQLMSRALAPVSYMKMRLLLPLGIPLRRYVPDTSGNPLLAAGMTLTAREWLRFGNFLMRSGRGGPLSVLQLIKPSLLEECFKGSMPNPMFGMGFWLNQQAKFSGASEMPIEPNLCMIRWPRNACISRSAPADLVASVGSYGQRLYVIPSEKLVIVRMGNSLDFSDAEFLRRLYSGK
ncbi:MAG: serine hydrolase domain-containing protein, partial [Chthoniobacterales bacterium]